jgi:uncharacterized damage-inducible protein DinB
MISPVWCRMMARYDLWQNRAIIAAADLLGPVKQGESTGAPFGSIGGTLLHLLWTGRVWMMRFDGGCGGGA